MGVGTELLVARWVTLTLDVHGVDLSATALLASLPELRQIEDRLGLGPKGLQDRRWRIEAAEPVAAGPAGPDATVTTMADYRSMLEAR